MSFCLILPVRLTKFNWLSKPSHGFLLWQAAKPSPDKKPNYFFIPPKFAFSLKLNLLVFPRLAFYLRSFCVNSPKSVFRYSLFLYICRNIYMSMKNTKFIILSFDCDVFTAEKVHNSSSFTDSFGNTTTEQRSNNSNTSIWSW